MSMREVKAGQIWRRVKDGVEVRVFRIDGSGMHPDVGGSQPDVVWRPAHGPTKGARYCFIETFRDRYEWVSDRKGER